MEFISGELLQKIIEWLEPASKSVEFWATLVAACGDSHRVAMLGWKLAYRGMRRTSQHLRERFRKRVEVPVQVVAQHDCAHLESDINCFGDPDM